MNKQRPLKFRIYSKENNKFNYFDLTKNEPLFNYLYSGAVIEQFTGVLDRTKKEIYEGDILFVPGEDKLFEVNWSDRDATFMMGNELWLNSEPIIVGNIHQNKDLLGE
jgi:hypothetical protein